MRPQSPILRGKQDERGQIFAGYILAVLVMATLVVYAVNNLLSIRKGSQQNYYREMALYVANAGFEDGLSYFRRQPDGVYLDAYPAYSPTSADWVTPWPLWPDAAFMPKEGDTDHYSQIAINATNLTWTAGALIRTIPLDYFGNTPSAYMNTGSRLWGRYVLRRQNSRNWSPGPNTMSAFTDNEAVHDLTHIRTDAKPGSGNYWSIFSRGYVFAYPNNLTIAAAHEGNCLLSAPKRYYPDGSGKKLLLATASVYGELFRINFNQPAAAVFVKTGNGMVVANTNGVVNGQGYPAIARKSPGNYTAAGGAVNGGYLNMGTDPSIAYCFPGLDKSSLKKMAANIDPTKVGGIECFPLNTPNDPTFTDTVSRTSFYYITTTGLSGNKIVFANGSDRVMSGVGLVIIDGNLEIQDKNNSAWAGVVFVDGDVNIRGPAEISGTLIATGTVTVGKSGDINKAFIEYNPDAVDTVQTFLQNFRVLTSSVVASGR